MEEVRVEANNLGKKYHHRWIFKDFNFTFNAHTVYGIAGSNGSGKSTLLKVLSQYLSPSQGGVSVFFAGNKVDSLTYAQNISFVAPYIDLIDELTLIEMLAFHFKFKEMAYANSFNSIIEFMGLQGQEATTISQFSSGMQQRLKLGLALYTQNKVLLLDEPTSFLDTQGKNWFQTSFQKLQNTLCIIASNDSTDLELCDQTINVGDINN